MVYYSGSSEIEAEGLDPSNCQSQKSATNLLTWQTNKQEHMRADLVDEGSHPGRAPRTADSFREQSKGDLLSNSKSKQDNSFY